MEASNQLSTLLGVGLFFKLFLLLKFVHCDLTISNYGYRDVVVSISPDVPAQNAQEIVNGIKVNLKIILFWILVLFTTA